MKKTTNSQQINLSPPEELYSLGHAVETIVVSDHSCNEVYFKNFEIQSLKNLREIIIGNTCFIHTASFKLKQLPNLEKLIIGDKSFVEENSNSGDSFSIKNCKKLREIDIGSLSFKNYDFEIDSKF